jgi:glycosyltransferase involved in cell wall biosynthesis
MIEKPWLSVVVPSHNGERWLAEALQSVVNEGDRGIEVILVDSSDTETSCAIAERFAEHLPLLRVLRRPDLLPWVTKTNFAVASAAADWICMLHQDDVWLPGRCTAVAQWLTAAPDAAMHLHAVKVIDAGGKPLGDWRCPLPTGAVPTQLLLERLLIQNFIAIPSPIIRREAYLRVGGLDEQLWYTADWDLYLKITGTGEVHYHPERLAGFRIHGRSLTMSGSRGIDDFRRQMEIVLDRHIEKLAASREDELRVARFSINVNVALAAFNNGKPGPLVTAFAKLLSLGPRRIRRYLRDSRIVERVGPRLRARLTGRL